MPGVYRPGFPGIHDQYCRCRACKPPLHARRPHRRAIDWRGTLSGVAAGGIGGVISALLLSIAARLL